MGPDLQKRNGQLVGLVGVVRLVSFDKYRSAHHFYRNFTFAKIKSRNKFQLLLKIWYFSYNASSPEFLLRTAVVDTRIMFNQMMRNMNMLNDIGQG